MHQHSSSTIWVLFSEESHCLYTYCYTAPEIDVHQRRGTSYRCPLRLLHKTLPRIVVHDVDASKGIFGLCKDRVDLRFVRYVQWEHQEPGARVFGGEVIEDGGFAQRCDCDFAVTEDFFCHRPAETGGRSGHCECSVTHTHEAELGVKLT
jgi:hypothetical protein